MTSSGKSRGERKCARCGAVGSGSFCSNCGASLADVTCRDCGSTLGVGSKFCANCGAATSGERGAAARVVERPRNTVAWVIPSVALVALTVMVAVKSGSVGDGAAGPMSGGGAGATGQMRAPDISQMSPREITDNLFNRVMVLSEQGLLDSARTIATMMAVPAFDLHPVLDMDLRYDLARIAEVTGMVGIAQAQTDTMLASNPKHLLALGLAARLAQARGASAEAADFQRRLLAAEVEELAIGRTEYQLHRTDVDSNLARARRGR